MTSSLGWSATQVVVHRPRISQIPVPNTAPTSGGPACRRAGRPASVSELARLSLSVCLSVRPARCCLRLVLRCAARHVSLSSQSLSSHRRYYNCCRGPGYPGRRSGRTLPFTIIAPAPLSARGWNCSAIELALPGAPPPRKTGGLKASWRVFRTVSTAAWEAKVLPLRRRLRASAPPAIGESGQLRSRAFSACGGHGETVTRGRASADQRRPDGSTYRGPGSGPPGPSGRL